MERPKKPELQYEQRLESSGVTVIQLTAESEVKWSNYLREDHFALAAIYRSLHAGEEVSNT